MQHWLHDLYSGLYLLLVKHPNTLPHSWLFSSSHGQIKSFILNDISNDNCKVKKKMFFEIIWQISGQIQAE